MNYNSPYVPNVHFELIPIKNLVSNQDYQRQLSSSHIIKAVQNFDTYQINPVKVSRRNNINYVFNGQHTIEIVAAVSGSRDTPVWCMIYDDLSYEHEADIFANQMKYVKPLTAYEIFVANIEAGNDKELIINELITSYNLRLSNSCKISRGEIGAVTTVIDIYDKYGYHGLDMTVRMIIGTWEGENGSFSSNMLKAIAKLIDVYGEQLDEDLFKEKMSSFSIKQISRLAKERRPGYLGYCEALVILFNGKKKCQSQRLPLKKLYDVNTGVDELNSTDTEE